MIPRAFPTAEPPSAPLEADGSVFDVVMLQTHVAVTGAWLFVCLLVALVAVPRLRRIPSPAFLRTLQVRCELVVGALCAAFVLSLATGTYLLFQQAAYDPPLSISEFDALERAPYALPYYYALYGKIALFFAMGAASFLLAREALRCAQVSTGNGGPNEGREDSDRRYEMVGTGPVAPFEIGVPVGVDQEGAGTRTAIRAARPCPSVSTAGLWSSVVVLAAGAGGIAFSVTLIKYFHELSRAAVVYQRLRGG